MADIEKKQDKEHNIDDLIELEDGPKVDENDENFNDDVDIDLIQDQLKEYLNISEFGGNAKDINEEKSVSINTLQKAQEEKHEENNISREDSMEINEIISMNDEITPEMLEQAENNLKTVQNENPEPKISEENPYESNIITEYLSTKNSPKSVEGYKKYIVYIDPENEEYINSLSIQERKDIINSILHGEDLRTKRKQKGQQKKDMLIQLLIVFFCVIIGFPLLYKFTNYCLTATINSYKEAQTNFEKLYKETGKIKVKKDFGM
ncbi:hypothetical protein IJI31_00420 [bacterium]|nr:hypothetical protein [bacterium]